MNSIIALISSETIYRKLCQYSNVILPKSIEDINNLFYYSTAEIINNKLERLIVSDEKILINGRILKNIFQNPIFINCLKKNKISTTLILTNNHSNKKKTEFKKNFTDVILLKDLGKYFQKNCIKKQEIKLNGKKYDLCCPQLSKILSEKNENLLDLLSKHRVLFYNWKDNQSDFKISLYKFYDKFKFKFKNKISEDKFNASNSKFLIIFSNLIEISEDIENLKDLSKISEEFKIPIIIIGETSKRIFEILKNNELIITRLNFIKKIIFFHDNLISGNKGNKERIIFNKKISKLNLIIHDPKKNYNKFLIFHETISSKIFNKISNNNIIYNLKILDKNNILISRLFYNKKEKFNFNIDINSRNFIKLIKILNITNIISSPKLSRQQFEEIKNHKIKVEYHDKNQNLNSKVAGDLDLKYELLETKSRISRLNKITFCFIYKSKQDINRNRIYNKLLYFFKKKQDYYLDIYIAEDITKDSAKIDKNLFTKNINFKKIKENNISKIRYKSYLFGILDSQENIENLNDQITNYVKNGIHLAYIDKNILNDYGFIISNLNKNFDLLKIDQSKKFNITDLIKNKQLLFNKKNKIFIKKNYISDDFYKFKDINFI